MHDKASALALDNAYKWEAERANDLWLTQPLGGGEIKTFTWGEAMAEARKMAGHLMLVRWASHALHGSLRVKSWRPSMSLIIVLFVHGML